MGLQSNLKWVNNINFTLHGTKSIIILMTTSPLFTVVTCTYNRKKFLDKCLNSIKNQTFKNFEHLIVDGYSTDGTYEKVLKYQKGTKDIGVRVVQSKPKGVSNAFNVGIKHAKGQYIIFMNSDDYFYDKYGLEKAAKVITRKPEILWLQGLTGGNARGKEAFLSNRFLVKPFFLIVLSYNCPASHQASIMHRSIFKKYGNFNESFPTHMDTDLYQRLLGKVPVYFTNIKLGVWRAHRDSISVMSPLFKTLIKSWKYWYERDGNIPFITGITKNQKYRKSLHGIWKV